MKGPLLTGNKTASAAVRQDDFYASPYAECGGELQAKHGDKFGIVTNPPFNIIEDFVDRAVKMSPYVALLCRLAFLESEGRMKWWKQVGLRRVVVIADRLPMMHRHNYDGPKLSSAGMCFGWFIFEQGKRPVNHVTLRWISWKDACRKHPETDADIPPEAKKHQRGLFEVAA